MAELFYENDIFRLGPTSQEFAISFCPRASATTMAVLYPKSRYLKAIRLVSLRIVERKFALQLLHGSIFEWSAKHFEKSFKSCPMSLVFLSFKCNSLQFFEMGITAMIIIILFYDCNHSRFGNVALISLHNGT